MSNKKIYVSGFRHSPSAIELVDVEPHEASGQGHFRIMDSFGDKQIVKGSRLFDIPDGLCLSEIHDKLLSAAKSLVQILPAVGNQEFDHYAKSEVDALKAAIIEAEGAKP